MYVCVCVMYLPSAYGDQKRALNTLELELQIVMNHQTGAGN